MEERGRVERGGEGERRGRRRKNFTFNRSKKGWEPAPIGIFDTLSLIHVLENIGNEGA